MRPNKFISLCSALVCAGAIAPQGAKQLSASIDEEPAVAVGKNTVTTVIPYKVQYQFDRSLGPGRSEKVQSGVNGLIEKVFTYEVREGKKVNVRLASTTTTPPIDAIVNIGRAGWQSSRGSYVRTKSIRMHASGYSAYENSSRTALGYRAGFGVVAVDPRVIKLGTHLFVEGYGFAVAGDTGGAIKGNRIDLCFDSYRQAMNFGRKTVLVHILE